MGGPFGLLTMIVALSRLPCQRSMFILALRYVAGATPIAMRASSRLRCVHGLPPLSIIHRFLSVCNGETVKQLRGLGKKKQM